MLGGAYDNFALLITLTTDINENNRTACPVPLLYLSGGGRVYFSEL